MQLSSASAAYPVSSCLPPPSPASLILQLSRTVSAAYPVGMIRPRKLKQAKAQLPTLQQQQKQPSPLPPYTHQEPGAATAPRRPPPPSLVTLHTSKWAASVPFFWLSPTPPRVVGTGLRCLQPSPHSSVMLGHSFTSPEAAARAVDQVLLALRGRSGTPLNCEERDYPTQRLMRRRGARCRQVMRRRGGGGERHVLSVWVCVGGPT